MKLDVRLFARAAELAGTELVSVEVPAPANVAVLRSALAECVPQLAPLVPNLFVSVNAEFADDSTNIAEGQEIACFPPVSGG